MNPKLKELRAKAMTLPLSPGVYIMKDKTNHIIYIGKAKALKNRVSQYFGSQLNHPDKVRRMVEHVDHFDYILTDSEFEALVLECSLIKQHTPKYNILLKDDKGYHYVRVSRPPWPRITEVHQKVEDGAQYIGPYTGAWPVKQAVEEAVKAFRLPTCNKKFPQDIGKSRPCLNFYIGQCSAPCKGNISHEQYLEAVEQAVEFLKGGHGNSEKLLTQRMEEAAEALDFEYAARLRDRIAALQKMNEKQKIFATSVKEQDVIALALGPGCACFEVFRFTDHRLSDRENFILNEIPSPEEARAEFISQYYSIRDRIPPLIALDGPVENPELLGQWLSKKAGRSVRLHVPQKGDTLRLVKMCQNNAAERIAHLHGPHGHHTMALDELGRLLGLEEAPDYIEAYDISNLAGTGNVAGMVVLEHGRPLKSAYRRFKIKTVAGQDDYGSMAEVLRRRMEEYEKAQASPSERERSTGFGRLPDLILLDGGKGHVSVVRQLLREMGYPEIPVFGMVKDGKHRTRSIAEDGAEIVISSQRAAFTLVSTLQEEVHRFAIGYHRQTRKRTTLASVLEEIPGVGQKRREALLSHFRTIGRIKQAEVEELLLVQGINRATAEAIYAFFHESEENS